MLDGGPEDMEDVSRAVLGEGPADEEDGHVSGAMVQNEPAAVGMLQQQHNQLQEEEEEEMEMVPVKEQDNPPAGRRQKQRSHRKVHEGVQEHLDTHRAEIAEGVEKMLRTTVLPPCGPGPLLHRWVKMWGTEPCAPPAPEEVEDVELHLVGVDPVDELMARNTAYARLCTMAANLPNVVVRELLLDKVDRRGASILLYGHPQPSGARARTITADGCIPAAAAAADSSARGVTVSLHDVLRAAADTRLPLTLRSARLHDAADECIETAAAALTADNAVLLTADPLATLDVPMPVAAAAVSGAGSNKQ